MPEPASNGRRNIAEGMNGSIRFTADGIADAQAEGNGADAAREMIYASGDRINPDETSPLPAGLSFEAAMADLESIVGKLEKGDLPLEESINAFRKGMILSKYCSKMLEEAERKITVLLEDEKGIVSEKEFKIEKEEGPRY